MTCPLPAVDATDSEAPCPDSNVALSIFSDLLETFGPAGTAEIVRRRRAGVEAAHATPTKG
jgi:hypothetical protein